MTSKSLFQLALSPPKDKNYIWDSEDLLDIIYWLNIILGAIFGTTWGVLQLTGSFGMVSYLAVSTLLIIVYVAGYQNLDFDDFGGLSGIAKEGFMNRFGVFLIFWILTYTHFYGEVSA